MVETWTERLRRLRKQHRLYLTVWQTGWANDDRLAANHEGDVVFAARIAGISVDEMLRRLEPTH